MLHLGKHVVSWVRFVVFTTCTLLFLTITIPYCQAYFVGNTIHSQPRTISDLQERPRLASTQTDMSSSSSHYHTEGQLQAKIAKLCKSRQFNDAIETLEDSSPDVETKSCYLMVLNSLVEQHQQLQQRQVKLKRKSVAIYKPTSNEDALRLHQANTVLQRLLELGKVDSLLLPSGEDFNSVIKIWGSSAFVDNASIQCHHHLKTLWSLYNKHKDDKFIPMYHSYFYTIRACSTRDRGPNAAQLAENLMKEMESVCQDHSHLTPDRPIANEVL